MASCSLLFSLAVCLVVFVEPKKLHMTKDAVEQLTKVFGIDKLPVHKVKKTPPEYMVDLYNSMTDKDGLARKPKPFNADVVRSFPDRIGPTEKEQFFYNVTSFIVAKEKILEAEFHVFRMRPRVVQTARDGPVAHVVELKVFQILDPRNMNSKAGLKLVGKRRISVHRPGWEIFPIKATVQGWIADESKNFGLLVSATTLLGKNVNNTALRIAQRQEHHDAKQPIMVIYTDNGQNKKIVEEDTEVKTERFIPRTVTKKYRISHQSSRILQILNGGNSRTHQTNSSRKTRRKRRAVNRKYDYLLKRLKRACAKHNLYVDFAGIGWSGWIISPKGYNAYYCKGQCSFPLAHSQNPTNHATVQSIVNGLGVFDEVPPPCCVPNKLSAISLLYFDDDENVILKNYDNMSVENCGCH